MTRAQSVVLPTWTGERWSVVLPVPSSPLVLSPQHHRAPSVRIPQALS